MFFEWNKQWFSIFDPWHISE